MGEALAALIPNILDKAEGVLMPSECQDLEVGTTEQTSRCLWGEALAALIPFQS